MLITMFGMFSRGHVKKKKKKNIINGYLVTVVILWMSVAAATALLDLSLLLNLSPY